MNIHELNKNFGKANEFDFFQDNHGLIAVKIKNKVAEATIMLYGAHVLSYKPINQKELLWMSRTSFFEVGKPIRGGIPVCFPWFGPNPNDSNLPIHGFARLKNWSLLNTESLNNGSSSLILGLESNEETLTIWPHPFKATIEFIVGNELSVKLTINNIGDNSFICTNALHSYFNISNVDNVNLHGLSECEYSNSLNNGAIEKQEENLLLINKELNRRYINHAGATLIEDKLWARTINVAKLNSKITVVWNPWVETTKKMTDMTADAYKSFVCIEAANTLDDSIEVNPGATHTLGTIISIK